MPRNKTQPLTVDDRVQYTKEFCRNTGQCTGQTPFARGTIVRLKDLGQTVLATINWDDLGDLPRAVNVKNLERCSH